MFVRSIALETRSEPDRLPPFRFSILLLLTRRSEDAYSCSEHNGETKFWLEADIELENNTKLRTRELKAIRALIEEHRNEIRSSWYKHFEG